MAFSFKPNETFYLLMLVISVAIMLGGSAISGILAPFTAGVSVLGLPLAVMISTPFGVYAIYKLSTMK